MKNRIYLIISFILLLFVVSCSECGGGYLASGSFESVVNLLAIIS